MGAVVSVLVVVASLAAAGPAPTSAPTTATCAGSIGPGIAPPSGGSGQPPAPPVPTGCATPDPFVALGGGTCVNGGWLPPGIAPLLITLTIGGG